MSLFQYRFKIKLSVKHEYDNKTYEEEWDSDEQGCNHIDNIPSVARYMGKEIRNKIKGIQS